MMTDTLYRTRTFWSPDKRHLVTVHVADGNILALQDDNGDEWEAAGEQENIQDYDDDEEEGDGYCQCGAYHDEDEMDNVCKCCGLPVDQS